MNLPQSADVVIVGGGVMGASTAYHLVKKGVKNVVLLEKEEFFGQGATGRCAGGVRYQFATEINIRLSQISLPMLENFAEETGQPSGYRPLGYLFVLTREEDLERFRQNVQLQHKMGVDTQWLSGDDIRKRLPYMNFEDALGGTVYEKDGLADPNSVVMGYISAAQKRGLQAFTNAAVTGIQVSGGQVQGVQTAHGTIATHTVVNAAGPWLAQIGAMAGVDIPVTPLRRQMFTTSPIPNLPPDFPFVIDFAQSLYFHPEGAGLLVGMSNPHEKPGFNQNVDADWELTTLEAALQRLPLLETAGLAAHWAGLYEVTPDAHPIFGKTPVEGFYLVGGFSGHGFMHGPVAGLLMSEIILDGKAHTLDVSSLDLARFAENRLIKEYNVV